MKGIFLNSAPAAYPINDQELKELLASARLEEIMRYRPCALITESVIIVTKHINN
ncbi:MAG: hypothetical protein AAB306_03405 [Pseudomonadota bacterium]